MTSISDVVTIHHACEELALERRCSGEHTDNTGARVERCRLHGRLHADERCCGVGRTHPVERSGRSRVAGHDDQLRPGLDQLTGDLHGTISDLVERSLTVWGIPMIGDVQHRLVRQLPADLGQDGETSDARVEDSDRCGITSHGRYCSRRGRQSVRLSAAGSPPPPPGAGGRKDSAGTPQRVVSVDDWIVEPLGAARNQRSSQPMNSPCQWIELRRCSIQCPSSG